MSAAPPFPPKAKVDAALTELPLFVVAGGIVPMTASAADTLLSDPDGAGPIDGLESVVVVGLGAGYTLSGNGTDVPSSDEADGAVVIDGNGTALDGHPDGRTTRVIFR